MAGVFQKNRKNLFWRSAYWSLWRHFEYGALLSAAEYSGGQHFNMIDKWNTEDLAKHGPWANSLFSLTLIRIGQRVQSCRTLLVVQILGGVFLKMPCLERLKNTSLVELRIRDFCQDDETCHVNTLIMSPWPLVCGYHIESNKLPPL